MRNFEIKNNDSLAPCGREKVYQSNLVNHSEGYLNIYSAPLTPALSLKGRGSQSGRSMIEMLGVLAIIGVLSVGGIAGYSKAMQKYRINKAIEQITLIAGNVRSFFAPQKSYVGVTCYTSSMDSSCFAGCLGYSGINAQGNPTTAANGCPIIKKAKILPDEMITVTNGKIMSITNQFGYSIILEPATKAKAGDRQAFRIWYYIEKNNVEECIDLVSQDWTALGNVVIGVPEIGCGGSCTTNTQYFLSPVNVDNAVATCSRASGVLGVGFYIDVNPSSTYWQSNINPS